MGPWIIGYGMFLLGLFTICAVTLGLSTSALGFLMTFAVCSLVTFILWWRDEQQWKEALPTGKEFASFASDVDSSVSTTVASTPSILQNIQLQQEGFSIDDNDFDLLETYTQDITQRVEAVYPLVDREHVHKIVWTVMVELFCKRMTSSTHATPASVIAAKMERAA